MNRLSSKNDYGGSGLGLLGETLPDTIKIEHVFTLQIPSKWDRPIRRWVDKCLDLSMQYAESFHFIAVGIGSYFFLLGCAKIVAAGSSNRSSNNNNNNNNDGGAGSSSSSSSSSSSKRKEKSRSKNPRTKEGAANTSIAKAADKDKQSGSTTSKAIVVDVQSLDSEQTK